jgi:hypothetical protein
MHETHEKEKQERARVRVDEVDPAFAKASAGEREDEVDRHGRARTSTGLAIPSR